MNLVENYKENEVLRKSLVSLVNNTFEIDLEKWYQKGCWGDSYIPFSVVDNNEVVANLSTTSMAFVVEGKILNAVQIGTVVTREFYRGKGHNSMLMRQALEHHKEADVFFLFADEDAVPYYEKYGFKPFYMSVYSLDKEFPKGRNHHKVESVPFDELDDTERIKKISESSWQYEGFAVRGFEDILLWYLVYMHGNDLFCIEEIETYYIGKLDGDVYDLYYVMSPKPYDMNELLSYIIPSDVKKVRFHFTPAPDMGYTVTRNDESIYIRTKLQLALDNYQFTTMAKA